MKNKIFQSNGLTESKILTKKQMKGIKGGVMVNSFKPPCHAILCGPGPNECPQSCPPCYPNGTCAPD